MTDTIAAISTPPGKGGIAVIRVSGPKALEIVNAAWKGKPLISAQSHSLHLGKYFSADGAILDETVAAIFKSPASFTGEDVVEISMHGSPWIQREILLDLVKRGARIANPGEFTQRAFLNGKLDLAQAEGVADLISSSSKAAHDLAIRQTKGSFSKEFNLLRDKLIEFASLLELELDFSEEDVEFADRTALTILCDKIINNINKLASSYSQGNVLKNGVPVVIAGIPNAGKSSLLNLLLGDDKAIVTDIPGTTRDTIEDTKEINGILYRFIDTAGLRDTSDIVEGIGVKRAQEALGKAFIVIWVVDPTSPFDSQKEAIEEFRKQYPEKKSIILINKSDLTDCSNISGFPSFTDQINQLRHLGPEEYQKFDKFIRFSSLTGAGMEELLTQLNNYAIEDTDLENDIIVTNARHYEALTEASRSLTAAKTALESGLSADFIAQDIREATTFLSEITGSITTDTLLHSIFSRFCIGK